MKTAKPDVYDYEMRGEPVRGGVGNIEETVTFHGRGLFHVGDDAQVTLLDGVRRGRVVYVGGDGTVEVSILGVVREVKTLAVVRAGVCPCGGTWGVCTYHGGDE